MNTLYIHIGRHKTGTTSIQRFFFENFESLNDKGFYYPRSGQRPGAQGAHHYFAESLTRQAVDSGFFSKDENVNMRNALIDEIGSNITEKNVVLSSEVFQGCDPKLLGEILKPLNPIYIVYIREQVGALISAYAEEIQITGMTTPFEEYINMRNPRYDTFLDEWAAAAGDNNLIVRIYDRTQLFQGDIVKNFLIDLGLKEDDWKDLVFPEAKFQNHSFGAALTEFKRLLNLSGEPQQGLKSMFTQLALATNYPKPRPTRAYYDEMVKRFLGSNRYVEDRYFLGKNVIRFPEPDDFADKSFPKLDRQTVSTLIHQLSQIHPGLKNTSIDSLMKHYEVNGAKNVN